MTTEEQSLVTIGSRVVGEKNLQIKLFPGCYAFAILDEREGTITVAQDLPDGLDIRNFWQPPGDRIWVATKKGVRLTLEGSDPDAIMVLGSAIFSRDNAVPLRTGGWGLAETEGESANETEGI